LDGYRRIWIGTMPDLKNATSPLLAVLACLLGIFLLSAMDAAVKGLVLVLGAYNVLLWRSIFATFVAGAGWAVMGRSRPGAQVLRLHILRGVVVAFVALTFFFGLGRLPLAEAIALSFIAPLLALFLAAVLLGEKIGRFAVWGSVVGMAGVVVIMLGKFGSADYGPGSGPDSAIGMAAILASAALYAYSLILARRQALVAKPLEIVFFQNLIVGVTLGIAAPWLGVALPQEQWLPLAGVTALALGGHVLMSWSYARAEAQYLIPTEYSAFIWAIVLGWVFFHEAVGWSTLAGAGLIIVGCLVASRARPRLAQPIEVAAV
jgi:S-adenosylmethionine uptake transporter